MLHSQEMWLVASVLLSVHLSKLSYSNHLTLVFGMTVDLELDSLV